MPHETSNALSVLVVEDRLDTAESFVQLLTLHGHLARVATSGLEALRLAHEAAPDVVLLDIGLPGMDGWEVARRLRGEIDGKQPIVVVVTGYGAEDDFQRSADSGVDLHMVKPADPVTLTRLLERIRGILAARDH